MTTRDWTPALIGAIYCSPACGGECTKAAYDEAVELAGRAAEAMGEGWTFRVWENLGWHYSINRGAVTLHPSDRGSHRSGGRGEPVSWTCYFNTSPQHLGHGATPQAALDEALTAAGLTHQRLTADLKEFDR